MPAPSNEILTTPSSDEEAKFSESITAISFQIHIGNFLSPANRVQELFEVYWTLLDPRSGMEVRAQKNSS